MRNFRKLKEISDYEILDVPQFVTGRATPLPQCSELYVLRMLVRAKYGEMKLPSGLLFLEDLVEYFSTYDRDRTGIAESWCYVTVRHGPIKSYTDDDFHFDGSSFRTDIIPERNYIWVNHSPTEYKCGRLSFPNDFDPVRHNLFTFAEEQLKDQPICAVEPETWYLLSPFCLHRRPTVESGKSRTFYRICFTDIEGRDVNNTPNPALPTDAYGRDPVKTFRNKLEHYYA